jgi:hypothetical protein
LRVARRDGLLGIKNREVLPDYLGRRIPLYPFCAGVPACDVPVRVEHEDRVVSNRLHHQLVYSAALLEGVGEARLGDRRRFALGFSRSRKPVTSLLFSRFVGHVEKVGSRVRLGTGCREGDLKRLDGPLGVDIDNAGPLRL